MLLDVTHMFTLKTCTNTEREVRTQHMRLYNGAVDGRPLCRDPNSCSALGAEQEQGQRETSSKQSLKPQHTYTLTNIHILCKCPHTHTHRTQCEESVCSYGPKRVLVAERDYLFKMT